MEMPFPPTPPENVTNGQLYAAIMTVASRQADHVREQEQTNKALQELQQDFEQYKKDHKDMVETWTTAKGTMKFIRFLAMIGVPLGAIWAIITSLIGKTP